MRDRQTLNQTDTIDLWTPGPSDLYIWWASNNTSDTYDRRLMAGQPRSKGLRAGSSPAGRVRTTTSTKESE